MCFDTQRKISSWRMWATSGELGKVHFFFFKLRLFLLLLMEKLPPPPEAPFFEEYPRPPQRSPWHP